MKITRVWKKGQRNKVLYKFKKKKEIIVCSDYFCSSSMLLQTQLGMIPGRYCFRAASALRCSDVFVCPVELKQCCLKKKYKQKGEASEKRLATNI